MSSGRAQKILNALIRSGAMHGVCVLEVVNLRTPLDSRFLHLLSQIRRGHEFSRILYTLPIEQHDNIARVLHIVEELASGFAGVLTGVEVRVENLFPAAVVSDFMTDQNMHHRKSLSFVRSRICISREIVNWQMNMRM
jgi:hypothetical protein